ncbi:amidohydrolase family protein [bacterium]|nr:amidohydrolase family protein [bacterium]
MSNVQHYRIGQLIIGDGSPPQQDVVLTVEGERIVAVDAGASVAATLPYTDLRPYTVTPGLIDAHTHVMAAGDPGRSAWSAIYYEELIGETTLKALHRAQASLRMGFTTLRDLGSRDYIDVAVRNAINAGLFAGPRLFVCGVPLTSTGGHFDRIVRIPGVDMAGRTGIGDSPAGVREAARYQIKMGADLIKIAVDGRRRNSYTTEAVTHQEMSFAEIQAAVEVAEWAGVHVAAHSDGGSVPMRDGVRAGVRTIEHIQDLSAEDADFLAASDAYLVPTLTATYNTVAAGAYASGVSNEQYSFSEENWQAKRRGMAQALRAGVKIALGTDAGYANCRHGESAKELLLLVETGMSPLQALTAATGTAAAAIGQAHTLGTVTPGKLADFVVVDGDPLADIGILTHPDKIVQVYKGGVLQ